MRKTLPFEDERYFEEAKKGLIAAPSYKQIMAETGNVIAEGKAKFEGDRRTFEVPEPADITGG